HWIELVRHANERQKHILRHIAGKVSRSGHAPGKPVDGVLVLIEGGFDLGFRHALSSIVTLTAVERYGCVAQTLVFATSTLMWTLGGSLGQTCPQECVRHKTRRYNPL